VNPPRQQRLSLVQGSFGWLIDNDSQVADWVSSLERVGSLLLSLDPLTIRVRSVTPLR